MSKYARKLEKIENGNWFMKSATLMGIAVLGLIVFGALSALGDAAGISFLETMASGVSMFLFTSYVIANLVIYTVAGLWGYLLHLFKEAFLLPWKFTPVIMLAWMFFVFQLGIGAMLMGVVQVIVMFCPALVVHMARNYYQSRGVIA